MKKLSVIRIGRPVMLLAVLILVFAGGCVTDTDTLTPQPGNSIIVYGRPGCWNCQSLRASLDEAGLSYEFRDVDADQTQNREMWDKIHTVTNKTDSITLPVVDVNGTILINHPTNVRQLRPYLKKR